MSITTNEYIYADYAATNRPLYQIEKEIFEKYLPIYANLHSTNKLNKMDKCVENAKNSIKHHLGCGNDYEIFFAGTGATGAINLANYIFSDEIKKREVFISILEHNSISANFSCDCQCKKLNILPVGENGTYNTKEIKDGSFCFLTACSNVSGIIQPFNQIKRGKKNVILGVDFAGFLPNKLLNISQTGVDFGVISLHKLLGGPQCPGLLIINKKWLNLIKKPMICGGSNIAKIIDEDDNFLKFEYINDKLIAGTAPILGIIRAGMVINMHYNNLQNAKNVANLSKIVDYVNSTLYRYNIIPFGGFVQNKNPILSFVEEKSGGPKLHEFLEKNNIFVRDGKMCAYLLSNEYDDAEWCRLSFSYSSKFDEVVYVVEKIVEFYTLFN